MLLLTSRVSRNVIITYVTTSIPNVRAKRRMSALQYALLAMKYIEVGADRIFIFTRAGFLPLPPINVGTINIRLIDLRVPSPQKLCVYNSHTG